MDLTFLPIIDRIWQQLPRLRAVVVLTDRCRWPLQGASGNRAGHRAPTPAHARAHCFHCWLLLQWTTRENTAGGETRSSTPRGAMRARYQLHALLHEHCAARRQHMPQAAGSLPASLLRCYEELLDAALPDLATFSWPPVDEGAPAGLCYTSGTTGNPKGIRYTHRSNMLHALIVPMPVRCRLLAACCLCLDALCWLSECCVGAVRSLGLLRVPAQTRHVLCLLCAVLCCTVLCCAVLCYLLRTSTHGMACRTRCASAPAPRSS